MRVLLIRRELKLKSRLILRDSSYFKMQINIPGSVVHTYRNLVRTDSSRRLRNPRQIRDIVAGSIRRESALCRMLETAKLENSLMYQVLLYDGDNCLGNYRLIIAEDVYKSGRCYVVKALLSGR